MILYLLYYDCKPFRYKDYMKLTKQDYLDLLQKSNDIAGIVWKDINTYDPLTPQNDNEDNPLYHLLRAFGAINKAYELIETENEKAKL